MTFQIPSKKVVQQASMASDNTGLVNWTFPIPYTTVPVITATCQNTVAADTLTVEVISVSTTGAALQVNKSTATVVSLIALTIQVSVTGTNVGLVTVNIHAAGS